MGRPGRRAAGLALGGGLLFAVGTNVQSGWVLTLAAVLLGAAFTGAVVPASMVRGIRVERRAPSSATAGESVVIDLLVHNRTPRSKLSLVVEDRLVAPATAFVESLGPHQTARVETIRPLARRGVHEGGSVEVSSSAPFGVATSRRNVPAAGRVTVYPRVVSLAGLPVLERTARPELAARTQPRHGTGQDFLGVREYRTGDSLRHVHWPSSARQGTLIVREFEREEPRRLGILIDTWADSSEADPETALDLACAAAASAAARALALGGSVGLAAGADGAVRTLVRGGSADILEWLASLRAPGGVPCDALAEAVGPLGRPDGILVVAPSWAANTERLPALAATVEGRGSLVQVLVVDAASFGPSGEAAVASSSAAAMAGGWGATVEAGGDLSTALAGVPSGSGVR